MTRGSHSRSAMDQPFVVGLAASLVIHAALIAVIVVELSSPMGAFVQPVVYSVSIEGGKRLGGIAQLPTKEKTTVAPPKAAAQPEPARQPERAKAESNTAKAPSKPTAPPDAEVSLSEKKPEKPKPTAVPTKAAPKAPEKKPEPKKPTAAPTRPPSTTQSKSKQPTAAELERQRQQALQRYLGESTNAGGSGFGAGALGGAGMGGGSIRPPEFFQYYRLLEYRIKEGWRWHDRNAPLVAQVEIAIARDGTLESVQVVASSGNRAFDDSVLRAVRKASPVPPPPASVYQYFERVRVTFDPRE